MRHGTKTELNQIKLFSTKFLQDERCIRYVNLECSTLDYTSIWHNSMPVSYICEKCYILSKHVQYISTTYKLKLVFSVCLTKR